MLAISHNVYLLSVSSPSLIVAITKTLTFDNNDEVGGAYTVVLDDRAQSDVILLSFLNAQPILAAEAPTSLPNGVITITYQGTSYPYRIWFAEDDIIISSGNDIFRRISNDHTDPVPLIKELIESINTGFPG